MEQVQRRFIKFRSDDLSIHSIGFDSEPKAGHTILPIDDFKLIEPFFDLTKNLIEYYPLIVNSKVTGFRRREIFESQIVLNTEDEIIRSLRSFENFIASARIVTEVEDSTLVLIYDKHYFDEITNQENIDRLTLVKDKVYNLYVTQRGNPYVIYNNYQITLEEFTNKGVLELPYTGPKEISVYVIAKDQ